MPYLRIETNVGNEKIPSRFCEETIDILSKAIGKPKNFCAAAIIPNVLMSFGGTTEPCAQAYLMSVGYLDPAKNKKISEILFKHIQEKIGIPQDRMYMVFDDSNPAFVGYRGSTFEHLFGN